MDLLTELNDSLKGMDIPKHRKHVDASGSNLEWLRKNLKKRNEVSPRLQSILDLEINQIKTGKNIP